MSTSGKAGIALLLPAVAGLLVVAGCTTVPPEGRTIAADWSSAESPVTPAPPEESLTPIIPPPASPIQLTPPPVAAEWFEETWVSLKRWCASNTVPPATRINHDAYSGHALNVGKDTLVLGPGNRAARWRGLEINLGFAPRLANGDLFVHSLDLRKTVEPLLLGAEIPILDRSRPVVIDPGHGGEDSGTRGIYPGLLEKDLALDWARRVAIILSANGWRVLLTRTNDSEVALSNRVALADSVDGSAFISLHFNSGVLDQGRGGAETYCLTPAGLPSTVTRGYVDDLATKWKNNDHDAQNLLLACRVQKELLAVPGVRDRGVRRARFMGVLRNQRRPAILVEGGYLSDPWEARMIASPVHRQKLAEAVAQAIIGREMLLARPAATGAGELMKQ